MRLEFLNARHGDCFLVRWDTSNTLLVDGGPDPTYRESLRPHLISLPLGAGGQRQLELVCITHVDDDHVAGALRLLTELDRARGDRQPAAIRIKRVWFNSVEELVQSQSPGAFDAVESLVSGPDLQPVTASINQGRDVRDRVAGLGLEGNQPFNRPIVNGDATDISGLHVQVIAPDQAALDDLARTWKAAKLRADPSVIAAAYSDQSVPNLASTVLLIENEGHTALLTGDARGDRILSGLEAAGMHHSPIPIHFDVLKLPHHGSSNNVERDFFERIHADHYVISADGIAHHHPSEDTLSWLVESRAKEESFVIHLTNTIGFALRKLSELALGRSFTVNVRPDQQRALVVELNP